MATPVSSSGVMDNLSLIRANPTAVQRLMYNLQFGLTDGLHFYVDATNPVVHMIECAAMTGASAVLHAEALNARQYSFNARSQEDLYLHMSDRDFLNRFANPSRTTFSLLLSVDEIIAKAVDIGNGSGVKKVVIPKHAEITASGLPFTLQYAIEIRVYPNDSISILWVTDPASPILRLTTNQIDWTYSTIAAIRFLHLKIPMQQMAITSQYLQLNAVRGFSREYLFQDKFYYCRAFTKATNSTTWAEIRTTHTDQVYDVNVPTALLKVVGNRLSVQIPQIYFTNGLIKDGLRLDIYTTKGAVELDLGGVDPRTFTARWYDHDSTSLSGFSAMLSTLAGISFFSETVVTGGSNGVAYETLRDRVITKSNTSQKVALTPKQLETALNDKGYEVVLSVDNISQRQYIATRSLPAPVLPKAADTNNTLARTAIGCAVQTFQSTFVKMVQHTNVKNNGDRITLTPDCVYLNNGGILQLLSNGELDALNQMAGIAPEGLANQINAKDYLYSPYYYVLDINDNQYSARAYRLDTPSIESKYYLNSNDSLLVEVSTIQYSVGLTSDKSGYRIVVELAVNDTLKAFELERIALQLSYIPNKSSQRIFLNGSLVTQVNPQTGRPYGDKYVYEFILDTKFDVDSEHNLIHEPYRTTVKLTTDFDLVCILRDHTPVGTTVSSIDDFIDPTKLDDYVATSVYRGVSHETMSIRFGDHLDKLWIRTRSVIDSMEYETYAEDVPAVYTETVFARDDVGNVIIHWDGTDLNEEVLHLRGDPVLDEEGQPMMKYKAGEFVLDAHGDPIPKGGIRGMLRQLDLLLLDARYYFATSETTVNYRKTVEELISTWVLTDLDETANDLLELTELFFTPKSTLGNIEAYTEDRQLVTLKADQTFYVTCYVSKAVNDNEAIRQIITRTIALTLNEQMQLPTISETDIIAALKKALGTDVISFKFSGLADNQYSIITLKDSSARPSIGKRLVALSNRTLAVQDAISVNFVEHEA